jgi:hypothetical protein
MKVMLKNVRLAFPVLNKPEQFQGEGKPRYSATLLIPKGDPQIAEVEKAMRAAAEDKWGPAKADAAVKGLRAANKTAFNDGDLKSDYQGFEGNMYVGAHAQAAAPPRLLDGRKQELPRDTGVIYPGCYVNASVEFWAQDNQYGKRINCSLRGIQFVKDGDSFAAGAPASLDEFEVVEGAPVDEATESDFA